MKKNSKNKRKKNSYRKSQSFLTREEIIIRIAEIYGLILYTTLINAKRHRISTVLFIINYDDQIKEFIVDYNLSEKEQSMFHNNSENMRNQSLEVYKLLSTNQLKIYIKELQNECQGLIIKLKD